MPQNYITLPWRFYTYCTLRFPLVFLGVITTLSLLYLESLSSSQFGFHTLVLYVSTVIYFYFIVRIIDEIRDFDTDLHLHPHRPIQSGLISRTELGLISLVWFIILSFFWPLNVWIICNILLFAGLGVISELSKHINQYVIHNLTLSFANCIIFVCFYLLVYNFTFHTFMYIHAILSFSGSYLIEIVRKIHTQDEDGYRKNVTTGVLNSIIMIPSILMLYMAKFHMSLLLLLTLTCLFLYFKNYSLLRINVINYYIVTLLLLTFVIT